METQFYTFHQNNTGGYFKISVEKGIGVYVIIEAFSASDANARAEEIGLYFDGVSKGIDCPCCGDRWNRAWNSEGTSEPRIYNEEVEKAKETRMELEDLYPYCVVHFVDKSRTVY